MFLSSLPLAISLQSAALPATCAPLLLLLLPMFVRIAIMLRRLGKQCAICTRESVLIQDLTRDKAHSTRTRVLKILAEYLWRILIQSCVLYLCTHVIVLCTKEIVLHMYAYKPSTVHMDWSTRTTHQAWMVQLYRRYRSCMDSFWKSVGMYQSLQEYPNEKNSVGITRM